MRMKRMIRALTYSTIGLFAAVTIVEAGTTPETLDINLQKQCSSIKGLPKDRKTVKAFSHEAHARNYLKGNEKYSLTPYTDEFTCSACHVGAKDQASLDKDAVCSGFDDAFEGYGGSAKFQNFFHKSCKGCHKAMKKDGLKSGPVSCKGCHGKK